MRNKLFGLVVRVVVGILLPSLTFAQAYARDYAVEFIVFERLTDANEAGEVWNFSAERIARKLQKTHNLADKAIDYATLPDLDTPDSRYTILSKLDNLAAISRHLVAAGYRILHSANWIQPAATYQNAPLISFGVSDSPLPYGFIKVYKTALIFVDIDVQYSPIMSTGFIAHTRTPTVNPGNNRVGTDDNTDAAPIGRKFQAHFFISEKRRLKFKEIHYLDHPLFGVIIGVWPSERGDKPL